MSVTLTLQRSLNTIQMVMKFFINSIDSKIIDGNVNVQH